MALTIETGAGIAGANSYATVAQAQAYAAARALTLPAGTPAVEALLIKAADFLESLEDQFKGSRVESDQALAWPRTDVYLFDSTDMFGEDEIPVQLINAQCQLAFDGVANTLQPTGSGREVIRTKVDVIETEYAKRGSGTIQPDFNKAMAILAPLLDNSSGFSLTTLRV